YKSRKELLARLQRIQCTTRLTSASWLARRHVHRRVPGIVNADEQQQQRGRGDEVERAGGMAERRDAGDEKRRVGDEGKANVPQPILEYRYVAGLAAGAAGDDRAIDHAGHAEEDEGGCERGGGVAGHRNKRG